MDAYSDIESSCIIAFIQGLMTTSQVEKVSTHLGYKPIIIGQPGIISDSEPANMTPPGEPLFGREAHLLDLITAQQPALIIFDLANEEIPWERWIPLIKSSPATRRIPILCYGPHVDRQALERANDLMADRIVPRSKFMSRMLHLIKEIARPDDLDAVIASCEDPISPLALTGLEAFNNGLYYEAHEHLEDAWNEDKSAARYVYKGVLQIAVAYYQIERKNYRGAIKMFLRSRQWLSHLPAVCRGIDIAQLRDDATRIHQQIVELGYDGLDSFDLGTLPPVRYQSVD